MRQVLSKVFFPLAVLFIPSLSYFPYGVEAKVANSENYILEEDVIGIEGGESTSEEYTLLSNMGEDVIGNASSANWVLDSGFIKPSYIEIIVSSNQVNLGPVSYPNSDTESSQITVYSTMVGYSLYTYFLFPEYTDTLLHSDRATYMEEKTDWDPALNGGNGNAALWSGNGFGFTLYSNDQGDKSTTWWGTGTIENDPNNKYSGFPTEAKKVLESQSYISSAQSTYIGYKIAPSETQKLGNYYGHVFFRATASL